MGDPTNPENSSIRRVQDGAEPAEASTFIEDLQKASQELEADIQRKKPISHPQPDYNLSTPPQKHVPVKEEIKESPGFLEKGFDQDLAIQAEEVAKEKKRLEEIQKNLEKEQKMVIECIQELTILQEEISKVLEGKKKIEEGLWKIRGTSQNFLRI